MPPTGPQLVHAIKRNFGGLEETGLDPEQMFFQRLPSNIDEPPDLASIDPEVSVVINPRHSCARVTVVVLCVCLSFTALAASASVHTWNQRYSQVSLRLFLDFGETLPFKSYGMKKPICK